MKNQKDFQIFYNSSSFKFFQRQLSQEERVEGFIKLINQKDQKESNNKKKINVITKSKKFIPELLYQKNLLEIVQEIRELFLLYDYNKSYSFELDELYAMFKKNRIPITTEELSQLFNFSKKKTNITFEELIKDTFDPNFLEKFQIIITNIKKKSKKKIFCPSDFKNMISHLNEYQKLDDEVTKLENKIIDFYNIDRLNSPRSHKKNKHSSSNIKLKNVNKSNNKKMNSNNKQILLKLEDESFSETRTKIQKIHDCFGSSLKIANKNNDKYEINLNDNNYNLINSEKKLKLINSLKTIHQQYPRIKLDYVSFDEKSNNFKNLLNNKNFEFPKIKIKKHSTNMKFFKKTNKLKSRNINKNMNKCLTYGTNLYQ